MSKSIIVFHTQDKVCWTANGNTHVFYALQLDGNVDNALYQNAQQKWGFSNRVTEQQTHRPSQYQQNNDKSSKDHVYYFIICV